MKALQEKRLPQQNKINQLETALAEIIANVSQRGFYGTAGIVLNVQDGQIQHIRASVERMMK